MIVPGVILWTIAAASNGCLPVEGDRITAADLARASQAFASAPPDRDAGYAPATGTIRVFSVADLRGLAARWDLATQPDAEICFVRPVAPLEPDRLITAMKQSFAPRAVEIELIEFSKFPAPSGNIEFPLSNLSKPATPNGAAFWKGSVIYAGSRRFSIWARVRVRANSTRLIARQPLRAGVPIAPGQIQEESSNGFPLSGEELTIAGVIGMMLKRALPAGGVLTRALLEAPLAVHRGDPVHVEAWHDNIRLRMQAVAAGSGRAGDQIAVRNPESGRTFTARVDGPQRVSVGQRPLSNGVSGND